MKTCFYTLSTLLLLLVCAMPAHADSITFSLDNTNLNGTPGSTITFSATMTTPAGNGSDIYLNGLNITDMSPLTTDVTDFLINFPLTIGPNGTAAGDLFTVTLPGVLAPGTYYGTATLLGGADSSAQDDLGSQLFSVTVPAGPAPTPEPGSFLLMMTGISGVIASRKLRSRNPVSH